MKRKLEELNATLKSRTEAMVNLLDKIDGETSPTEDQLKSWNEERVGIADEIKTLNGQIEQQKEIDGQRMAAKATLDRLGQPLNAMLHEGGAGGGAGAKSLGAQFLESEAFKGWIKQHAGESGRLPESRAGGNLPASGAAHIGSLKSLILGSSTFAVPSDSSANALVIPEHRGLLDMGPFMRPLRIVDLITQEPTASELIYFARGTSIVNAAAPTAEATSESDSSGTKPKGSMTFEVAQAIVRTIPVWVPVTRQALADAGQLRSIIDTQLRYDVARELEDQIVTGSGSGENFKGVENLDDALSQPFSTDLLITARKARTNILINGRVMPSAWVMHPNDWEQYDMIQDAEQRYYFGGPMVPGRPTLWGVPVVESEAKTQGQSCLADWSQGRLADREQTTIRVSDSHSDYFTRNLMAVLAEMRAAFYVPREQAFCLVELS